MVNLNVKKELNRSEELNAPDEPDQIKRLQDALAHWKRAIHSPHSSHSEPTDLDKYSPPVAGSSTNLLRTLN